MTQAEAINKLKELVDTDQNYAKTKEYQTLISYISADEVLNFTRGCRFDIDKMEVVPYTGADEIMCRMEDEGIQCENLTDGLKALYAKLTKKDALRYLEILFDGCEFNQMLKTNACVINTLREVNSLADDYEACFINCVALRLSLELGL